MVVKSTILLLGSRQRRRILLSLAPLEFIHPRTMDRLYFIRSMFCSVDLRLDLNIYMLHRLSLHSLQPT